MWWDYEGEKSLWTTEYIGNDNNFIIKHRWHGWARNHQRDIELFENNSYLALNADKAGDRHPGDPMNMFLHVTNKKEDAIIWKYDAYLDPRQDILREFKTKIN